MSNDLSVFGTKVPPASSKYRNSKGKSPYDGTDEGAEGAEAELVDAISLVQWAVCGPHTYKPVSSTFDNLTKGIYTINMNQNHGIVFKRSTICVDNLLQFPDSLSDKILKEITTFWNKGDKFKEHGFLHRRGFLFHGPAGSGKTCLVQQIIANIIDADGLVFQCTNHPQFFNEGLALYRKVEPDRPVVCLFEDIDAIIEEHGEDEILTLLDGEQQIDKVLNIATTNYPEKLEKRLVARPRRFDQVIEIGMPSKAVRKVYFEKKLNISEEEIGMWLEASDGFSFAACAELVISVCCFNKPFEEAVKGLKEMMKANLSSSKYDEGDEPMGFAAAVKR